MDDIKCGIRITTRDRLLRAWKNSMELVCDFQSYANEIKDHDAAVRLFEEYAEEEGRHAAQLLELLKEYERK